ncbi:uncharacterized protein LOC132380512 isoform X2 [Hypanus sabinus]|uniref:uncharacterized protein LOC132380512 isoform X2 n=1 Tax=Hypanus sabinus TaxID=79690 RepID=UPI0028C4C76C|nr:uncharacterized protein LOC132380512 isoform X2 [Hypanus sabinus]
MGNWPNPPLRSRYPACAGCLGRRFYCPNSRSCLALDPSSAAKRSGPRPWLQPEETSCRENETTVYEPSTKNTNHSCSHFGIRCHEMNIELLQQLFVGSDPPSGRPYILSPPSAVTQVGLGHGSHCEAACSSWWPLVSWSFCRWAHLCPGVEDDGSYCGGRTTKVSPTHPNNQHRQLWPHSSFPCEVQRRRIPADWIRD